MMCSKITRGNLMREPAAN